MRKTKKQANLSDRMTSSYCRPVQNERSDGVKKEDDCAQKHKFTMYYVYIHKKREQLEAELDSGFRCDLDDL